MSARRYLSLYFAEAEENLRALDRHVLALEGEGGGEALNAAFRAAHNLKGMSATVGFGDVAARAHVLEDRLEELRTAGPVSEDTVDELLAAVDALREAVGRARSEEPDIDAGGGPRRSEEAGRRAPAAVGAEVPESCTHVVRVAFRPDTPLRSVRATLALRRAEGMVELLGHAPELDEDFHGDLLLFLAGAPDGAALEEALLEVGDVEAVVVEEPGSRTTPAPAAEATDASYVRVERRHVDALADGVGALAAQHGRLKELLAGTGQAAEVLDGMGRLLAGLRVAALGVRLVPVSEVFDRFPRLVRGAARSVGREVEFRLEGRAIELDRAILDEVAEPVLHLLRNAVDHGIEPAGEREAAGKPRRGRIVLRARRERSGVVIEVEDDGRGIPLDAIRQKAIDTGLVTGAEAADWSVEALLGVLSRPGFSAAERISELSGRGVGLDVAVERVSALGGAVELDTGEGRGTVFRLILPVSLSAAEAVWIRLGGEDYAVPLTHIVEAVEVGDGVELDGDVLSVGDDRYTVVELGAMLSVAAAGVEGAEGSRRSGDGAGAALLAEVGGRRAALVVDGLLGRETIVVKEFDAPRGAHPMLSGVTLRGDGRPALVLDPAAVV